MIRESPKSMRDDVLRKVWFSHPAEATLVAISAAICNALLVTDGRCDTKAILLLILAATASGATTWACHRILVGRSCSPRRRLTLVLLSLVVPAAWVGVVFAWYG